MAEFTGERVIPGQVDEDLLNEHLARYLFAARFSEGAAVLDAGCGSGYGTAELGNAASVTAMDVSADALAYACENFARPGVRFVKGACESLPFADAAFDLVTAFEVIEHLEQWEKLLSEACRTLKPGGVLLVSTPNKAYYAEMRAKVGPNPFHCHEFGYEEFQAALYAAFPHVRIWAQNHVGAIVFAPFNPAKSVLEAAGDPAPGNAHFFVAACSQSPILTGDLFAWLPSSGNVLRERELHIAKLEGELTRKDAWLDELKGSHAALQRSHEAALAEVKERSLWARELDGRIGERDHAIRQLQNEAEERLGWLRKVEAQLARADREIERLTARQADLEAELTARTEWARSLDAEVAGRREQVLAQMREIAQQGAALDEQARQLEELRASRQLLQERQAMIAQSKWVRVGRSLGVGPVVDGE